MCVRNRRDLLFSDTVYCRMLQSLYDPNTGSIFKTLKVFWLMIQDYHLLFSVFFAHSHTNISARQRWAIMFAYIFTCCALAAQFYGTSTQASYAVIFCGLSNESEYEEQAANSFCADWVMVIFVSLISCFPAYFFMALFQLSRPMTVPLSEEPNDGIYLKEGSNALVIASAIYKKADDFRTEHYFGKEKTGIG